METTLIQSLKDQLYKYQEDFKLEEQKHEIALKRIAVLEQELRIVERQLQQYQLHQMEDIAARRQAALQYYKEEYMRTHPHAEPSNRSFDDSGYGLDVID